MLVHPPISWTSATLWRPLKIIVTIVVLLAGVSLHLAIARALVSMNYKDFGKFYYSAQAWQKHLSMYGPTPATRVQLSNTATMEFLNMNPPHFQAMILPFTLIPIGVAYALWLGINVGAAAMALRAAAKAVGHRLSWRWGLTLLLAAPTLTTTLTGQLSGLLGALVCWIWLEIRAERWWRAAGLIGLACSIKPFLTPLVAFLILRRHFRAAAVSATIALSCFAIGAMLFGVQSYVDWIHALRTVSWEWEPLNGSIYALIARLAARDALAAGTVPGALSGAARFMGDALAGTILVVGMYLAQKDPNLDRAVLILLATCLLVSPLGWVYYAWLLAAPAWASWSNPTIRSAILLALGGWMVPYFLIVRYDSMAFTLTIGSAYTWSLVMLWVGVAIASACGCRAVAIVYEPPLPAQAL